MIKNIQNTLIFSHNNIEISSCQTLFWINFGVIFGFLAQKHHKTTEKQYKNSKKYYKTAQITTKQRKNSRKLY